MIELITTHSIAKVKSEMPQAMKIFFKSLGVPEKIICDGAAEQVSGESKRLCQQCDCKIVQLERGTPWENRAELYIGIVKRKVKKTLKLSNAPMVLW